MHLVDYFADVDAAIRAIQADPSNLEAARALLANLSPTAAASVLQLVSKSGVLPPAVMSALSTSTTSASHAHPRIQNQLSEILGQLASMEPKGSVSVTITSSSTSDVLTYQQTSSLALWQVSLNNRKYFQN